MLRVLVCDDAEPVRVTLTRALQLSAGAAVRAVATAEEALTVATDPSAAIDVVVMDQDLPGMAGCDAIRALRDGGIDVPVLLFTADRTLGNVAAADPALTYLCKADAPIGQVVSVVTRLAGAGRSSARPE